MKMNRISWLHDLCMFLLIYVAMAEYAALDTQLCETIVGKAVSETAFVAAGLYLILPLVISELAIQKIRQFFCYLPVAVLGTWLTWVLTKNLLTTILTGAIFVIRATAQIKKGQIMKQLAEMPGSEAAHMQVKIEEIPTLLDIPKPLHFAFFCGVYLFLILAKHYHLLDFTAALLAVDVILYFIYYFFDKRENFISQKYRKTNFPGKALKRISSMAGILLLVILLLLLAPLLTMGTDPLCNLSFERTQETETKKEVQQETLPETDQVSDADTGDLMGEMAEPPAFLVWLAEVTQWLILLAVGVAAVWGIFHGMKKLMSYYAFSDEEADQIIFLKEENNRDLLEKIRKGSGGSFFDQKHSIRRKYYRLIRRGLKGKAKPKGSETPTQLEQLAGVDAAELHDQYEKARYCHLREE